MEFEFDKGKSISNKIKHGVDFYQARKLWEDPEHIIIPARTAGEERYVMIAQSGEDYWTTIYTLRGEVVRIISVRKSRQNEKAIYNG